VETDEFPSMIGFLKAANSSVVWKPTLRHILYPTGNAPRPALGTIYGAAIPTIMRPRPEKSHVKPRSAISRVH
jgi:hypothetical protein